MKFCSKYYKSFQNILLLFFVVFIVFPASISAENLKPIMTLEGSWKFTVGDDTSWADPNYNDSDWDVIRVPGAWENYGYKDYNGYAWYRKRFSFTNKELDEYLFLLVGYIDDVDEVYVNGYLVGSNGTFPPLVKTAYQNLRRYPISKKILSPNGVNVIAVRVYDEYLEGGICNGPVGIYYDSDNTFLNVNLAGYWDFSTEKQYSRQTSGIYGSNAGKLFVPETWESQGYPDYDGRAVYKKQFQVPSNLNINDIILVLGFIDDVDEVYLNGTKIGSVYNIKRKDPYLNSGWEYKVFRAYRLPPGLILQNGWNTITVKVNDTGGLGGIYEGPVGLTTVANFKYLKERNVRETQSFWDAINEFLFD
ncbi:beta galactosidase jelly roll domain-containing protein [bacterium]|nr:beta galactosidase jelly roll domain-containing protein [bacterium]